MAMIRVWNSAYRNSSERFIPLDEVNVVTMKMDYDGRPYMIFEHRDFPLGGLRAEFIDNVWDCDLN